MATQTDVQTLIQGLAPAGNNGNPNTAYNNAPGIPMSDANGNWFLNNLPTAASINLPRHEIDFGKLAAVMPAFTPNPYTPSVPVTPPTGGGGGTTTPPPVTLPTAPPNTPPFIPGHTGGQLPPVPGDSPPTDVRAIIGTWGGGEGGTSFEALDRINLGIKNGQFAFTNNTQTPPLSTKTKNDFLSKLTDKFGSFFEGLSFEKVLEGLLPGNQWLEETNKLDLGGIASLLAGILGLGPIAGLAIAGIDSANESKAERAEREALDRKRRGLLELPSSNDPFAAGNMQPGMLDYIQLAADQDRSKYDNLFGNVGPVETVRGGSCVAVDSFIFGSDTAEELAEQDTITIVEGSTLELGTATVTYSQNKLATCVRITTANGVSLVCSYDAPIGDTDGNQVKAIHLAGLMVPTFDGNEFVPSEVIEVRSVGQLLVQHISCEDNFFLAGEEHGKYLLHHNKQQVGGPSGSGTPTPDELERMLKSLE